MNERQRNLQRRELGVYLEYRKPKSIYIKSVIIRALLIAGVLTAFYFIFRAR